MHTLMAEAAIQDANRFIKGQCSSSQSAPPGGVLYWLGALTVWAFEIGSDEEYRSPTMSDTLLCRLYEFLITNNIFWYYWSSSTFSPMRQCLSKYASIHWKQKSVGILWKLIGKINFSTCQTWGIRAMQTNVCIVFIKDQRRNMKWMIRGNRNGVKILAGQRLNFPRDK